MKRIFFRNFVASVCGAMLCGLITAGPAAVYAEGDSRLSDLNKRVLEGKDTVEECRLLEEIRSIYFQSYHFNDFVAYLKEVALKKKQVEPLVSFYIAQARYAQLKYLEEFQLWDEYFSQGNDYRADITDNLKKTFAATSGKDGVNLKARLIAWQFHRDQQDVFHEDALTELMEGAYAFSKESQDASLLRDVADVLLSYGEKGKSKELYKIYVEKMVKGEIKDEELGQTAAALFQKGNLELSQLMYDVYIGRISASLKEKAIPALLEIAGMFGVTSSKPEKDLLYAEKVYATIEEIGTAEIFNETLQYERALNLEKAKEFTSAKNQYLQLLKRFPETARAFEVNFKIGMIDTYVLRDPAQGKVSFTALAGGENINAHVIASFYQLGLVSQWENDLEKAKGYYGQLIEKSGNEYEDTVSLAKERLKEIEEAKPLEYNLKTFLDISLNPQEAQYDMTKLALRGSNYLVKKDEETNIISNAYTQETGCMQVSLQYLWSGHTGTEKPALDQASFPTIYKNNGIKEINLIVVSPTGIIDRDVIMIDVN